MHVFWHDVFLRWFLRALKKERTIYYRVWAYITVGLCKDTQRCDGRNRFSAISNRNESKNSVTRIKNGISNTFYLDTHSLNRYSLWAAFIRYIADVAGLPIVTLQLKQKRTYRHTTATYISYITAIARHPDEMDKKWCRAHFNHFFDLTCK